MTAANYAATALEPARPGRRTPAFRLSCLTLLLALAACHNGPVYLEPARRNPSFVMEDPLPDSPEQRSITYYGKNEKRELAKLHLRFGMPEDESHVTFDINKDKRSVMAETPVARTEKTATYFSFGAHKDHKMMVGLTLKISF